jgi:hypothetical protein
MVFAALRLERFRLVSPALVNFEIGSIYLMLMHPEPMRITNTHDAAQHSSNFDK